MSDTHRRRRRRRASQNRDRESRQTSVVRSTLDEESLHGSGHFKMDAVDYHDNINPNCNNPRHHSSNHSHSYRDDDDEDEDDDNVLVEDEDDDLSFDDDDDEDDENNDDSNSIDSDQHSEGSYTCVKESLGDKTTGYDNSSTLPRCNRLIQNTPGLKSSSYSEAIKHCSIETDAKDCPDLFQLPQTQPSQTASSSKTLTTNANTNTNSCHIFTNDTNIGSKMSDNTPTSAGSSNIKTNIASVNSSTGDTLSSDRITTNTNFCIDTHSSVGLHTKPELRDAKVIATVPVAVTTVSTSQTFQSPSFLSQSQPRNTETLFADKNITAPSINGISTSPLKSSIMKQSRLEDNHLQKHNPTQYHFQHHNHQSHQNHPTVQCIDASPKSGLPRSPVIGQAKSLSQHSLKSFQQQPQRSMNHYYHPPSHHQKQQQQQQQQQQQHEQPTQKHIPVVEDQNKSDQKFGNSQTSFNTRCDEIDLHLQKSQVPLFSLQSLDRTSCNHHPSPYPNIASPDAAIAKDVEGASQDHFDRNSPRRVTVSIEAERSDNFNSTVRDREEDRERDRDSGIFSSSKREDENNIGETLRLKQMGSVDGSSSIDRVSERSCSLQDIHVRDVFDELTREDLSKAAHFRSIIYIMALSFHGIFEGMALGLQGMKSSVWALCFAIVMHRCVLAFKLGMDLCRGEEKQGTAFLCIGTFTLISALGIIVGILISSGASFYSDVTVPEAILQSLATGTIFYIVFLDILFKDLHGKDDLKRVSCFFVGFSAMAVVFAVTRS